MNKIDKIKRFAQKVRKNILSAAFHAGSNSSHFGGALSCADIISVLYSDHMNFEKSLVDQPKRDRFILSKGHGCLALYGALVEKGLIPEKDLETFEKNNTYLLGHPVLNRKYGIEFSNGSLGLGLSLGIGVAIGLSKKKLNSKVFVLLGDGECNEGSIWEAAMFAKSMNLKNLTVIIDNNGFQQTGSNDEILNLGKLEKIWRGFGWHVVCCDGHNIDEIKKSLLIEAESPKVIIAKTIKGKGFQFSENNNEWHHKILTKEKYDEAINQLGISHDS